MRVRETAILIGVLAAGGVAGGVASGATTGATGGPVHVPTFTGTGTTTTSSTTTVTTTTTATPSARVSVSPRRATRRGVFVVRFTAPDRSGADSGIIDRTVSYVVSAGDTDRAHRCTDGVSTVVNVTRAGDRMVVRLRAPRTRPWCAGTYNGTVTERFANQCGPIVAQHSDGPADRRTVQSDNMVCPLVVSVRHVPLGRFSFVVS